MTHHIYCSARPNAVRVVQKLYDASSHSYPYPDADNLYGDDLTNVIGGDGYWHTDATSAQLGSLDSCGDLCDYSPVIEIADTARSTNTECIQAYNALSWCPAFEDTAAMRRTPVMSTCTPGSGNFRLFPVHILNHDNDSNRNLVLRAVQTSGTGDMTTAAWVNSITVGTSQGQPLRVIKPNRIFRFDAADQLVDAATVSKLVTTTTTSFTNGMISGSPTFVTVEVPKTTMMDFTVTMSWSCAESLEQEEVFPIQGYTFDIGDLGCSAVAWPQKFTIRPKPTAAPTLIQVEMYGSLADRRSIPLHTVVGGGESFSYEAGGLAVSGTLLSHNSNSASVHLDEVAWGGINLCAPGTYTLPAED